ncbi:MAG: hypothetical protein JWP14_886 [Frankiales bacterium]|nr:hypothetical protein [Frankiales bacterium]
MHIPCTCRQQQDRRSPLARWSAVAALCSEVERASSAENLVDRALRASRSGASRQTWCGIVRRRGRRSGVVRRPGLALPATCRRRRVAHPRPPRGHQQAARRPRLPAAARARARRDERYLAPLLPHPLIATARPSAPPYRRYRGVTGSWGTSQGRRVRRGSLASRTRCRGSVGLRRRSGSRWR